MGGMVPIIYENPSDSCVSKRQIIEPRVFEYYQDIILKEAIQPYQATYEPVYGVERVVKKYEVGIDPMAMEILYIFPHFGLLGISLSIDQLSI